MSSTATGRVPVFLHVSGVALVCDFVNGDGDAGTVELSNDLDVESIRSIPPAALHRNVDDLIFEADKAGKVNGYIIAPGTVFGTGSGPCKRVTLIYTSFVQIAKLHREVIVVGKGTNTWNEIHINDLTDLLLRVIDRALSAKDPAGTSPYEKFYWAASRSFVMGDMLRSVAKALHAHGLIPEPLTISLPVDEAVKKGGLLNQLISTNSRVYSARARSIGWEPKDTTGVVAYSAEGIDTIIKYPHLGNALAFNV